ncbi:hypothetical protein BUALT_Bualt12G0015700 [Buddleja alternifolia]|uniref:R13L1/DRL21-like LRR repeat region domain-containing protein n=1 Tax=Buddleja alternifolia TaxID=168488 RepID=A0AAV6WUM2_9LAMI|nr:hypothetical protein BUALT_Bualt12G0015700 [Buddleja alternifolia]
MSCFKLKRLPESLTYLFNLQTLKLTDCNSLLELPKSLRLMKNLWFLEMEEFPRLHCTPPGLGELTCLRTLSIFIVGQDASHQIDQLKELNLGGNLSIQGLENVRNFEDAKSANLMRKKNLISLSLSWKNDITEESAEYFEEVLKGLQPHENLEKICINSYEGSRFPNWMSTLAFKHLNDIRLKNCGRCEHLPTLGKLSSLKSLKLKGMNCIKYLGTEWVGNEEISFPSLKILIISEMPNLEEWIIPDSVESFPCLKHLKIKGCPKLTQLPFLPALRDLNICRSSLALVGSITSLTSLTSLVLSELADLDVFPVGLLQNHKSLEDLQIVKLPIKTLSNVLDNLSALKNLYIDRCDNLEFIAEGLQYLNSLENLDICWCGSIRSFPAVILESLSSLRSLSFQHCKILNPLSGPLQKGTDLQRLDIYTCWEMKHLPESVQQLSALRKLLIWNCKICDLPNWLGSLQSLRVLRIRDCKPLAKRCKKPNGKDWPKISHIPCIEIDLKIIQDLDPYIGDWN